MLKLPTKIILNHSYIPGIAHKHFLKPALTVYYRTFFFITCVFWHASNNIRIARVGDHPCACPCSVFTGSAQFYVAITVVMDISLAKCGVIGHGFRCPPSWAVVAEDTRFRFALPDYLQSAGIPACAFHCW